MRKIILIWFVFPSLFCEAVKITMFDFDTANSTRCKKEFKDLKGDEDDAKTKVNDENKLGLSWAKLKFSLVNQSCQ